MIDRISAVIISKNADLTIASSLDSLKDFKEVVVFDSGSKDKTEEIVKSYDNTILYRGDFLGFGETKNYAVSLASNDWVFSLDADELLSDDLISHLKSIDLQPKIVGKTLRKNFFLGKEITTAGWGRDKIIRLFNRTEFYFSDRKVHEKVEVDKSANIIDLRGFLKHDALNNLSETLEKANLYSELYANENEKSYPIIFILIKSFYAFFRTYFLQKGFMAGWRGVVIAFSNSVGVFYKYIKIYVKKKSNK
jgi:glycosyltransferase involved in cell wall biosynthesis